MANIKGRVVDYDTDLPVLGVLVQGIAQNGTVFTSGTTDASGNYDLNHSGFDDLYSKIVFKKEGYAEQSMRPSSANNVDVVLPKANTLAAVTLTLKQNPSKAVLFLAIGALAVWLFIKYRSRLKI
jgi:uncharacterized protein YfaS (alpha-2-macroglobulin family)